MARSRTLVASMLLALAQGAGCTDPGVIGELDPCAPGCAADQICDAELGSCVACLQDADCAQRGDGLYCQASACVECRSSGDCGGDAGPLCTEGRCQECVTDDDCDDERSCEAGRCVEVEDDGDEGDDEEESGNEGEGGDDG